MGESLAKHDESLPALIQKALEAHGLTPDALACELERAQGSGVHKSRGPLALTWNTSYDLPLCKYCGRANPLKVCPEKVKRLLAAGEER